MTIIDDVSFDDQATQAMGEAFDRACESLGDFGNTVTVRETVAKRIIEVAKTGKRDPAGLCRQALNALGFEGPAATKELAA